MLLIDRHYSPGVGGASRLRLRRIGNESLFLQIGLVALVRRRLQFLGCAFGAGGAGVNQAAAEDGIMTLNLTLDDAARARMGITLGTNVAGVSFGSV